MLIFVCRSLFSRLVKCDLAKERMDESSLEPIRRVIVFKEFIFVRSNSDKWCLKSRRKELSLPESRNENKPIKETPIRLDQRDVWTA